MNKPRNRLFCRLDGTTPSMKVQERLTTLSGLGLLTSETIPVFEEATQTASGYLDIPICIFGLAVEEELWFKSANGLSSIGLMNELASYRKIALSESFSTYVIDSEQPLIIENTLEEKVFSTSSLTQHYGIRSYLGVPLISCEGLCIGTLEVMDFEPRQFSSKDIDFLALTARWCLREFERDYALEIAKNSRSNGDSSNKIILNPPRQPQWQNYYYNNQINTETKEDRGDSTNSIKVKLLAQLTQELRTPLTSVIGMASVLRREVYGPLTNKQREYLEIIHNSGQNLISLVDEIVNLGVLGSEEAELQTSSVDTEMLSQQVINSLLDTAKQHQQGLRLSVEPGNRIWSLDKDKIKQALYYLIISVLEMSESGGEVRVHVSRRNERLNIAVWLSHPWLGDGLPQVAFHSQSVTKALEIAEAERVRDDGGIGTRILTSSALMSVIDRNKKPSTKQTDKVSRDLLGLLFCCHLTEIHQGKVMVQGTPESGYRYILQLPKLKSSSEIE